MLLAEELRDPLFELLRSWARRQPTITEALLNLLDLLLSVCLELVGSVPDFASDLSDLGTRAAHSRTTVVRLQCLIHRAPMRRVLQVPIDSSPESFLEAHAWGPTEGCDLGAIHEVGSIVFQTILDILQVVASSRGLNPEERQKVQGYLLDRLGAVRWSSDVVGLSKDSSAKQRIEGLSSVLDVQKGPLRIAASMEWQLQLPR
mmetsp:Transcript_21827/g.60996  ORF Transcript_21827/g.60996 Transcript_21827/m.60996 type:complete len:203 (+) Transcript_21827:1306-1914(+)